MVFVLVPVSHFPVLSVPASQDHQNVPESCLRDTSVLISGVFHDLFLKKRCSSF